MRIILELIEKAGGIHPGLCLKIDNPPFMELVIEAPGDTGPSGLPSISVAHYGLQNGDLMRDPEMCFEWQAAPHPQLLSYFWRNDYLGWEQWSRYIRGGLYGVHEALHRQHERFAALWDRNLRAQGYWDIFDPAKHIRG